MILAWLLTGLALLAACALLVLIAALTDTKGRNKK